MERSFGSKYGKWIALTAVVLALVLWFVLSGGVENYRAKYEGYDLSQQIGDIGRSSTYSLYLRAHEGAPDASSDVSIPLVTVDSDGVTAQKDGLLMQSGSSATFAVTVPETGFYNIRLTYRTEAARGVDLERELRINGEVPFDGADTLTFTRLWHDGGEVRQDSQGNDIRPTQVEVFGEQNACCRDSMGYITEPYRFYFEAGESTVTLIATSEPMLLTALSLTAPEKMPDYAAYAAAQPQENSVPADFALVLEGESSTLRSSPSLYARYDRSSPATSPCDVRRTVLNYIGGDAWRDAGQWIEWDFDVPENGWYNITIKGRQTYNRGSVSSRILYLDGKIPFSGMENVSFPYTTAWEMNTLSDDSGTPYRFYLSAGHHTLRLEATLGDMGQILSDMEESIYRLNQMYRRVLVLTGVNPDRYRDYHLEQVYPEVIEAMAQESRLLYKLVDETVAITGQKSDRIAVAQTLAVQLESFVEDPAKITEAFTNFKDNITSLGTSMQNMRQVKLDIDLIAITADSVTVPQPSENFLDRALHELKSCVTSYFVDYNALGDVYDASEDVLEVWILTGRDQSTVLKTSHLLPAALVSNGAGFVQVDENGKYYNAAETDAFLEAMNWVMDMVSKYEMKAPEGAEWNYFESAFINGEVALQVHEDYFAGSLANMEDDYGFVFFPKGPRAETYLYAPSDNIMVIPACYDADRAWKIAFAYNLFTNPTPGYTDSDDWKNGYYQKYRDERAVDETITMMREPEHQFVWYSDMVTGYDLGSQYIWDVYAQATTPAEKAESMRGTWQAYIDEANAN